MSSRQNKSSRGQGHRFLTKAHLLPMDRSSAIERSLACHLALAACRDGHGNTHLINELMRAVYLGWYLQRAGYGNLPAEQFKIAEYAVENTLAHAHETGEWRLEPDVISDFEALLCLHDAQLAKARLHEVQDAERQLLHFLKGKSDSPIPGSP
ncbi:hypothetical protein R69927_06832 [Paraburkholderia domus]|jgi:hypothetical protein|uniref:hypothetical protein n=1 Tax=Paraburkholderia domus TaxID=2793075 RepID=UPI001B1DD7E8|nr:hypothetical protein [Paraburkholderia domus]CAE6925779.1 hypothetical protein R69927_06832 [Paraburkholderia domus]